MRGGFNMQGADVLVHGGDHFVGQRADGDAAFQGAFDDFVVNIRDISHISDFVTTGFEPALHHVKRHHHAGMADMAQVINRHATDVHAHMAGLNR